MRWLRPPAIMRRLSLDVVHAVAVVAADSLSRPASSQSRLTPHSLLVAALAVVVGAPRRVGSTLAIKSLGSFFLAVLVGRRSLLDNTAFNSKVWSSLVAAVSIAMATVHATKTLPESSGSLGSSVIPASEQAGDGKNERLGDMDVYVVGKPAGGKAIILIYDIHGVSVQCRHNCDMLAQAGFLVVMPDLFRGSGRSDPNFKRPQAEVVDQEILNTVVPFVRAKGGNQLGIVGFCFGGAAAMRLAASGAFAACGGVHSGGMGSPAGELLVRNARCPIMLLQAGGDPLLKPVWDVMKDELAEGSTIKRFSVIRTYWDQNHGWCGAGGDRKGDPRTREAVESAMSTMTSFFNRCLLEGAVVVRSPVEEVLLQGGNPSQVPYSLGGMKQQ